jgi:DNA-binding LytR/AlgR family response regulator
MIRIAIVDDEPEQIEIISKITSEYLETIKIRNEISTFSSGEDLLQCSVSFDLIFLDIQMHGMDGIETAQKIRSADKKVTLIYVSNFSEKMAASFLVHPFAFLEKPIKSEEIQKHLQDYIVYIDYSFKKNMISFTAQHGEITVDADDILYLEYIGNRKIRMVMADSSVCISGNIVEILKRLESIDFISPHKSFIVNEKKICLFYNSLIMENGDEIPIAKNRKKQIQAKISVYMHRHLMD